VRTENVVARPESVAKAFVDAGGVSPADAGSLIAFFGVINGSMGGAFSCRAQTLPVPDLAPGPGMHLFGLRYPRVAMMQTADLGDGHHPSPSRRLNDARERSAVVQSAMGVRTENVVGRPDSAAKAFVDAGGVSPADAGSLIAFHRGGKWEEGRRFFLPGADAPCARHDATVCHAPLPASATRM
jgi:hypothetical protein